MNNNDEFPATVHTTDLLCAGRLKKAYRHTGIPAWKVYI